MIPLSGQLGRNYMANRSLSDKEILKQLPAAKARSRAALAKRVCASAAHVDPETRFLTVVLTNGSQFSVPTTQVPGLQRAPLKSLTEVALDGVGMGLHWPSLDVDLSVAGLARVMLGDSNLLAAAGAAGGQATSSAKAEAARRNGMKGGRPKKPSTARKILLRFKVSRVLGKFTKSRSKGKAAYKHKSIIDTTDRRVSERRLEHR